MVETDDTRHKHCWLMVRMHENDDRVRTVEACECGAVRYGCRAKRLGPEGEEDWGPVGQQFYRIKEPFRE